MNISSTKLKVGDTIIFTECDVLVKEINVNEDVITINGKLKLMNHLIVNIYER